MHFIIMELYVLVIFGQFFVESVWTWNTWNYFPFEYNENIYPFHGQSLQRLFSKTDSRVCVCTYFPQKSF